MVAVIFDLELIKRFRKGQPSEIVEIGACKVDLEKKEIIDQIQIYVNPKRGHISKSTRKFIKMKDEDINKAVSYETAILQFVTWLGDKYYLCSWGKDDKAHFINQSAQQKMNLDWFRNYNDIQKPIGNLMSSDLTNQLGLKNALKMAGIEPTGKAHRGIDDAINTAELFIKFIDKIELKENSLSQKEIHTQFQKYKRSRFRHKDQKQQTSHTHPASKSPTEN
ncbi:exonuclease domain-containing protein [Alkalihalobacillus sp. MEB130]|uniref:3'-5' exonuclease n=1 Tax=Alkalihalobacillus sp. MEB130 TaxID=2976704 RepID=UPI0028DF4AFF|nr:3'-5' exonuclease [Alkalihalobacillus sp. MEB130]MDT8859893.1 exonuclease domain-containing protein [Alkalihalobacillus sp. MEB130]